MSAGDKKQWFVRASACVCASLTTQRRERVGLCEGGLFLASHFFFPPAAAKKCDRRPGNESWQQAIICLPHTHTHTEHLTVPSNTRHGNGTAAIRGKEPFPSIEEETESEMKGRKK